MAFSPELLEDGDAADVLSVTDRLGAAKTWIDAVDFKAAMRRGAWNHVQTGRLFPSAGSALVVKNDDLVQTYTQATFGVSITYNAYGDDGGTDTAASYTGDRAVVGHPDCPGYVAGGGSAAKITLPGGGYLMGVTNGDRIAALLVLFNAEVWEVTQNAANREIMFCIQFKLDSSATWWTIDETESFVSHFDQVLAPATATEDMKIDVPIATLITTTLVGEHGTASTDRVTGIRAMCSMRTAAAGTQFSLHRWNLSVIPIYASYANL